MKKKTLSSTEPCKICVRANSATSRSRQRIAESSENSNIAARLSSLQEDLQQRIASDLHDSTCQHLIAATLSLLRLRHSASDAGTAEKICDEIDASINQALEASVPSQ